MRKILKYGLGAIVFFSLGYFSADSSKQEFSLLENEKRVYLVDQQQHAQYDVKDLILVYDTFSKVRSVYEPGK